MSEEEFAVQGSPMLPAIPVAVILKFGHLETALLYQLIRLLPREHPDRSIRLGGKIWLNTPIRVLREEYFPFVSAPSFSRTISRLEKCGAIDSIQPFGTINRNKCLRATEWFANKLDREEGSK